MTVEVLARGRFQAVPDATVRAVGPNAFEIRLPVGSPIHARCRRRPEPEAWDGAIFSLDGVETEPAVGSGADAGAVQVTVLILGQ